jgi:hypothetical protein
MDPSFHAPIDRSSITSVAHATELLTAAVAHLGFAAPWLPDLDPDELNDG